MPGLANLRDLILIDFAEQLKNHTLDCDEVKLVRLTDELVHYILKISVRESCILLRECQTTDKVKFEEILSSVPVSRSIHKYLKCCVMRSHAKCDVIFKVSVM